MVKTKKQAFDIPFIGYDYGKDFGWDFDVLFGTVRESDYRHQN